MKQYHQEEPQALVERILTEAIDRKASDVYWLPCAHHVNVRLRIDGVQQDIAELPLALGEKCVTRIKVLAGLLTYRTKIATTYMGNCDKKQESGNVTARAPALDARDKRR